MALAGVVALAPAPPTSAQGRAEAKAGDTHTNSQGSLDGVKVGMTLCFTDTQAAGRTIQPLDVALFRVTRVAEHAAEVTLTQVGDGRTIEPGMRFAFDQRLAPPAPATPSPLPPRPAAPPRLPADPAEHHGQVAAVDPTYAEAGTKRDVALGFSAVAARDQAQARRLVDGLAGARLSADPAASVREPGAAVRSLGSAPGEKRSFGPSNARYAWVPAGTFQMGCVPQDAECDRDEKPRHPVTLSRGFWMKETEVTVGEYRGFARATGRGMAPAPSFSQRDDHPVVNVTWDDATAYCRWAGGRLPSEAEWELAARGGRDGAKYPWGGAISHNDANYDGTSDRDRWEETAPVASFAANGFGLFDMVGNVWEWVADWHDSGYYARSSAADPTGPSWGSFRVLRGGSWSYNSWILRVSYRSRFDPSDWSDGRGFRCARDVEGLG